MTDVEPSNTTVLYIDDDRDQLRLVKRLLSGRYHLITAESGPEGLLAIEDSRPDLILLDINMSDMNGYEVCASLQANEKTAYIPVVFLTARGADQDEARAFAVGAAGYLVKPIKKSTLIETVKTHLTTNTCWENLRTDGKSWHQRVQSANFIEFKEYVAAQLGFDAEKKFLFSKAAPADIYSASAKLGIEENTLSRLMSRFIELPYLTRITPEAIRLGALPTAFCKANYILPIKGVSGGNGFVVSNPFDLNLMDTLVKFVGSDHSASIGIAGPGRINFYFSDMPVHQPPLASIAPKLTAAARSKISRGKNREQPVVQITETIFDSAVTERASDIHIEPKERKTEVRFRIDGDLRHAFTLQKKTGSRVISSLKVQGGMDIAEKRKPQDGGFATTLGDRVFNIRLSTTSTPNGESLVMRLLEPYATPKRMEELGMSNKQSDIMLRAAGHSNGMILVVGATGSGKTTTIYSLLHSMDHKKRSIISVEDPVEYRIPFVNQQQVNERSGVTFEALLKTSVRQDPDILFMGEIRDGFSAKMAVDFASTGHLTITSLHTSNATTAVFRLQRLGIDRGTMADTIIVVVAQKLIKRLCPYCKETVPITPKEVEMFAPFTNDIPSVVAHPAGCHKCRDTGYLGREGVYEVLQFDAEVAEMVRSDAPISEIRSFLKKRGDYLISTHAISKARNLVFTPQDVFEKVLAEEEAGPKKQQVNDKDSSPISSDDQAIVSAAILLVEDDKDTRNLLKRFLEIDGYAVTACADGIEALLYLGKKRFDLIIADINMPNLDGFKLLEMVNQKGINEPIIFLTSRTDAEDEAKGLRLGATDYLKKPINKELLSLRIKKVLKGRR